MMTKALIRGRWTWKNSNGVLVKGTHDFNFEDVHDMPWLKGDPEADEDDFWAEKETQEERFEQRVEDLVLGWAEQDYIKEEELKNYQNPIDFEVKDWDWVVIDGEWQEFIKPGFEISTILDTLKKIYHNLRINI